MTPQNSVCMVPFWREATIKISSHLSSLYQTWKLIACYFHWVLLLPKGKWVSDIKFKSRTEKVNYSMLVNASDFMLDIGFCNIYEGTNVIWAYSLNPALVVTLHSKSGSAIQAHTLHSISQPITVWYFCTSFFIPNRSSWIPCKFVIPSHNSVTFYFMKKLIFLY